MLLSVIHLLFIVVLIPSYAWAEKACNLVFIDSALQRDYLIHYEEWNYQQNPLTVGVEVEALIPYRLWMHGAVEVILQQVQQKYREDVTQPGPHEIHYNKNNNEYVFSVGADVSINSRKDKFGIEIRSPTMRDNEDEEFFLSSLERLVEKVELEAEPETAGVHVHVGIKNPRFHEVALLIKIIAEIETQLYDLFAVTKYRREAFVAPVRGLFKNNVEKELRAMNSLAELLDKYVTDARTLNLLALNKYSTAEVKLFNSTVDKNLIREMMDLSKKLVVAVRTKDPRLVDFLEKYSGQNKLPLFELVDVLGVDLKHHKKLRRSERMLAWKQKYVNPTIYVPVVTAVGLAILGRLLYITL